MAGLEGLEGFKVYNIKPWKFVSSPLLATLPWILHALPTDIHFIHWASYGVALVNVLNAQRCSYEHVSFSMQAREFQDASIVVFD